jgi:hypothetical protein
MALAPLSDYSTGTNAPFGKSLRSRGKFPSPELGMILTWRYANRQQGTCLARTI